MSWRVVVYGLAGIGAWVAVMCVLGPWVGRRLRNMNPYICAHCEDDGCLLLFIDGQPEMRYCNFCMLGQQQERAATRRANQGETK